MSDYPNRGADDLPLFAGVDESSRDSGRNAPGPAMAMAGQDPAKLSRSSHPGTSSDAADRLVRGGNAKTDAADALALVLANPGRTGYELEAMDQMPSGRGFTLNRAGRIQKRLAGLADCASPLIERGPARICFEHKTKCVTWWPAGRAPRPDRVTSSPSGNER